MTQRISARTVRSMATGVGLLIAAGALNLAAHVKAEAQEKTEITAPQKEKAARRYSYFLTMNGSTFAFGNWSGEDYRMFRGKDQKDQPDRLIVVRDKVKYEITDKNTIKAVAAALAPVIKLGRQQGELGRQQGGLGRQQGALGRQQGELGRKQGDLGRRMAKADDSERADLVKQQEELSRQQEALGHKQEELGQKQSALGKKQEALGKKQEVESAKADAKITSLLDDAFAKNLAHPLSQDQL